MEYQKINLNKFKRYIKNKDLPDIYVEMLINLINQANNCLDSIETEGYIIKEVTREKNIRYRQNPLIPLLSNTYSTIAKILKQNNLVLQPEKQEVVKEVEVDDDFTILQNNLNNI